jgi:hypothetical protein
MVFMPPMNLSADRWMLTLFSAAALLVFASCAREGVDNPPPPAAPTFTISGTVTGLQSTGLLLRNNGGDDLAVAADGWFTFARPAQSSEAYRVTVATQPGNQTCSVANGSGTIAGANVSSIVITCETALVPLFVDHFNRPDQPGLGLTPDGQVWLITGPGYLNAAIQDGRYVSGAPELNNNVSYIGLLFDRPPIRIGGTFSFVPSGTGGNRESLVALILSNDTVFTLRRMVHLIASRQGIALTWWQENDQNNWPAECQGEYRFATPLRNDGTPYPLYMTLRGDTVTVDKPDGTRFICTDPHFSQLAGTLGIWELAYDSAVADVPRWDMAEAFAEAPTP